jgi:UrcA family protein
MNSSSIARRYAVVAIATLAAGLAVNHAGAAEPTQAPTVVVRYADLDLSRPKDAQRLYYRLYAAAQKVCRASGLGSGGGMEDLARLRQFHDCLDRALTNAVTDVNSSQVTAIQQAERR